MDLLYKNFIDEKFDSEGNLERIGFRYPANFNYAYDVLDMLAEKHGGREALVWLSAQKQKRVFSFCDIQRESQKAANLFAANGIKKGDVVLLVLKRHWQFWPIMMALCRIGAIAVPSSFMLTEKDFEYRFKLANVKAVVCTIDGDSALFAERAAARCPSLKLKFTVNGARDGWQNYDNDVQLQSAYFPRPTGESATSAEEPMLMYFTSGTTSNPKMAVHSFTYPLGHIVTAKYWQNVQPGKLHLTISDTGWSKSAWGKLYGQWLAEAVVFAYDFDKFVAKDILSVISENRICTFCAPPTMYRFMIHEDLSRYDLSSLAHLSTAGEALNAEVYNRFYAATGLKIMEGFGQTETTVAVYHPAGSENIIGSMGKPSPAYDLFLADTNGDPVAPGQVGEISIRTENGKPAGLFLGYYRDEQTTARVWHGGIYRTGDMAWADENGYYWYVGRADDLIKSSGYRVSPFEIESVLMEHAAVMECAVTGIPDELRGQIIKATIKPAPGVVVCDQLGEEIKEFVKKNTAPYKYPRVIEFVDELPKTASGKIRRCEIRAATIAK